MYFLRAFWKLLIPDGVEAVAKLMQFQCDLVDQSRIERKELTVHFFVVCVARKMKGKLGISHF